MNILENCRDVLTVHEAAEVLRISDTDMQSLIDCGKVNSVSVCGKILVLKPYLTDFLARSCKVCYSQTEEAASQDQSTPHLDNRIKELDSAPLSEGDTEMANSKINQPVMINGEKIVPEPPLRHDPYLFCFGLYPNY